MPDAYVVLGNGTMNAFAAGHGFRRYICLYSDLFEIGGKSRDPQGLRFIMATRWVTSPQVTSVISV